jgi:hypothetical protein
LLAPDVDECGLGKANCHPDAVCANTPGGFSCACAPGFDGDGVVSCSKGPQAADFPSRLEAFKNTILQLPSPGLLQTNQAGSGGSSLVLAAASPTTKQGGTVAAFDAAGGVRYVPPYSFAGQDQLTYTVKDALGRSAEVTASIDVAGARGRRWAANLGGWFTSCARGNRQRLQAGVRRPGATSLLLPAGPRAGVAG